MSFINDEGRVEGVFVLEKGFIGERFKSLLQKAELQKAIRAPEKD